MQCQKIDSIKSRLTNNPIIVLFLFSDPVPTHGNNWNANGIGFGICRENCGESSKSGSRHGN